MPLSYDWTGLTTALSDLKELVALGISSRFDTLTTKTDATDSAVAAVTTRVTTLESSGDVSALTARVGDAELSLGTLTSRVTSLEAPDGGVFSRIAALEATDSDVSSRLETLTTSSSDAVSRLSALEGADGGILSRIEALESATQVSSRLDALEAAISQLSAAIEEGTSGGGTGPTGPPPPALSVSVAASATETSAGSSIQFQATFSSTPSSTDVQYWTIDGAVQLAESATEFTGSFPTAGTYSVGFFHRDASGTVTTATPITISIVEM